MSVRSRQEVLEVLRRAGMYHLVEGREADLPDQVDTDRDRALLEELGIYRGDIMDALGSSP